MILRRITILRIEQAELEGVSILYLDSFKDHRGEFVETYNEAVYKDKAIDIHFVQDDISVSTKNVLRGIHGDSVTWKLISCIYGEIYFVVVNCDKQSENFGKWQSFILSDKNRQQILVPPEYGNGYLVLSDAAIFNYKQSAYYDRGKQFSYKWDDQRFNITWPVKEPILSQRDKSAVSP